MSTQSQCKALTQSGKRCKNESRSSGLCGVHLPKPKKFLNSEAVANFIKVSTTVVGVVGVIEKLVLL